MQIAEPLLVAIEQLSKLPSIGKKTAQRLALFLLKSDEKFVNELSQSLVDLKSKIKFCSVCFNLSVNDKCEICESQKRNRSVICVVEEASDVIAIEKTNEYNGLYHVLGGVLSPLTGQGIESLKLKELLKRLESDEVKEIVLALNPDTEGETTTLYLAKILKPLGLKISRIARGIPVGGDLEFADEATIGRAVLSRIDL